LGFQVQQQVQCFRLKCLLKIQCTIFGTIVVLVGQMNSLDARVHVDAGNYLEMKSLKSASYCCSINCNLCCCFTVGIYPHCLCIFDCGKSKVSTLAGHSCCFNCDLFTGNGWLNNDQMNHLSNSQQFVFKQSLCSRCFPCCCLSNDMNKGFFTYVEQNKLVVIPTVCCYQICGYTYYPELKTQM
jgi:hypothetical protein